MRVVIAEDLALLRDGMTRLLRDNVEPTYAQELLADRGGGVGYLLKDRVMHVVDFLEAVRRVADGGTALDPDVVAQLFSRHSTCRNPRPITVACWPSSHTCSSRV